MELLPTAIQPGVFLASPSTKFISPSKFTPINRVTGPQFKPRVPGGNVWGTDAGTGIIVGSLARWAFTYNVTGAGSLPVKPASGPFGILDITLTNLPDLGVVTITFDTSSNPGFNFSGPGVVAFLNNYINGSYRSTSFSSFVSGNTLVISPRVISSPLTFSSSDTFRLEVNFNSDLFDFPISSIVRTPYANTWRPMYSYITGPIIGYPDTVDPPPYTYVRLQLKDFPRNRPITVTFDMSSNSSYSLLTGGTTAEIAATNTATANITGTNTITVTPIIISNLYLLVITIPAANFTFPILSIVQAQQL